MRKTSVAGQSGTISDQRVALAGNEPSNVGDPVDDWYRLRQQDVYRQPALEWSGPVAFTGAYRIFCGIEHDFGTRWGSNGDQRVSLRVEVGGDAGLLYVYDPTWDEYAVLGTQVPLASVENAFGHAQRLGDHLAVEDFVALLPNVPAARPSPGLEL
jgi:hypothetical protein